jgi:hypothetical protein
MLRYEASRYTHADVRASRDATDHGLRHDYSLAALGDSRGLTAPTTLRSPLSVNINKN